MMTSTTTSTTIAGHAFTVKERAADLVSLRIALQGSLLSELALKFSGLGGVSVTKGPEGLGRPRTFVARCAGFRVILSADETPDAVSALIVPVLPVADAAPPAPLSGLRALLTDLMKPPAPPPKDDQPLIEPKSSPLRRTALAPGKPLARKTPLTRRTPLGRGKRER
jgi:hypothetical protein